jgi:hypothetical protein
MLMVWTTRDQIGDTFWSWELEHIGRESMGSHAWDGVQGLIRIDVWW